MQKDMLSIFINLAPRLEEQTGGPVHLIKIIGSRWSYASGTIPPDMPFVLPQKVVINTEWALMFYPKEGFIVNCEAIRALFV